VDKDTEGDEVFPGLVCDDGSDMSTFGGQKYPVWIYHAHQLHDTEGPSVLAPPCHLRLANPLILGLDHGEVELVPSRPSKGLGYDEDDESRVGQVWGYRMV
jgi:hypothetical protein